MAKEKPSRAASVTRREISGTWRTSPASPTSPNATKSCGSAKSCIEEATARVQARSVAGSESFTPPTVAM